jgi:hypothetical protein
MENLGLIFMTVNGLAVLLVVMYHAAHVDDLRSFGRRAGGRATPSATSEAPTSSEPADYVRRGLDDLAVMLAQAARKRPR